MKVLSRVLATGLVVACSSLAGAALNFEFIYETSDYPAGISSDGGKAIIDTASGPAIYAPGSGAPLQPVSGLSGFDFTHSSGLSGDGSTVIGRSHGFSQTQRAFRWTQASGAVAFVDPLNPIAATSASDVSSNGSVVVGYTWGSNGFADVGWRWTAAGGFERLSGYQNFADTNPHQVSADGSVIAGTAQLTVPGGWVDHAFRWTEAGGFELLPDAPLFSNGYGISGDGRTIVGSGSFASGDQAFRWTEDGGFQQFEHNLQYFLADTASAASYDGSVITGQGRTLRGHEAWIWDEQHGVRLLTDMAAEMGIDLQGQHLESATSISADGTVIAGRSFGPLGGVGYVMVVPEPGGVSAAAVVAVTVLCRRRRR